METTTSNKSTKENPILNAALEYLKEGLSVVKIIPGQKRVHGPWSEYQKRLPTETELREWFTTPYYQLGVICGLVSGGFFAIDFDGEKWMDWYQSFVDKFPEVVDTRAVLTGSGKLHSWCRCKNLSNIIQRLGGTGKVERIFPEGKHEAIELRLNRCMMMAPPSRHPNGEPYKFLNKPEPEQNIQSGMIGFSGWSGYAGSANPILDFSEERVWEMVEFLREEKPVKQVKPHGEIPELTDEKQTRLANFYVRNALRQVENGASRNEKGFQLGCNLRDLGLEMEQAIPFMEGYQGGVPERDHVYTSDEVIASLESAYEGERKDPWIPEGFFGPEDGTLPENQIQNLLNYPLTDTGNAESFIEIQGDRFIFIPENSKWLMWDGVRWLEEDYEPMDCMIRTARARRDLSGNIMDGVVREKFLKWNIRSEDMARIKSSLKAVEIKKHKSIKLFDTEPFILCCENGVVNLRTGEFRRSTHNDWISKSTYVHYEPEAQCPRWLQFMDEIFQTEDMKRFIKRSVGYSLTGSVTEECFWICYGTGANGKSTLFGAVSDILGDYAQVVSSTTLKEKRDEGIPTDVACLCGARFVKMSEMKERVNLNTERLKYFTGRDEIKARFLYQKEFQFYPQFKLWMAVNHKPPIKDTTEAMWRRVLFVKFNSYFPPESQDKNLKDILREERSGILNWAIEGCLEWQEEGLNPPPEVLDATREYQNESDALGRFIDEMCIKEGTVTISDLHEAFCKWWIANETDEPWKIKTLKSKLVEKEYIAVKGGRVGGGHWEGLSLK